MLPKFLYGTYKRYKDDTTTFLNWIVEAAKQCGHSLQTNGTSNNGNKPKSKAAQTSHKISLKELSDLANVVAKSNLTVSPLIIATAQRAVSLRKKCARFYSRQKADDAGHSHFISILEQFCELLDRRSQKTTSAPDEQKAATQSIMLAGTRFAQLTLDEDEALHTDEVSSPKMTAPRVQLEDEEDDDGPFSMLFFKLYCLFEDLHNMREFISQSAADYVDGKIDLINLAVCVDTAVHLAKQLVEEVMSSSPELKKQKEVQSFIYVSACYLRGESPDQHHDQGLPFNANMADVAEWCYLPTTVLLMSFRDVLRPGHLPVFKKGHFGTYDPKANRDRMSAAQKFDEDKIILLELLPEFALIQQVEIDMPVRDEITRSLVKYVEDKEVPVALCFATQLLMDVHHTLRRHKNKAFNDLRLSGMRILKTIQEYWDFSKTFSTKPAFWSAEAEQMIERLHGTVKAWVEGDVLYDGKLQCLPAWQRDMGYTSQSQIGGLEKHYLLRSHATLSGLMMFNFTLRMQELGIGLINQWYDIPQLAYLYNIVQHTGRKGLRWPDMDAFVNLHGVEHIFVGGRPTTAEESLTKLTLAAGVAGPGDYARNGRKSSSRSKSNGKARLMKPSAAVANIFQDRYMCNGTSKISIEHVDKLLLEITLDGDGEKQVASTASAQLARKRLANTHRMGVMQILAAVKEGLYLEEPRLHYNYFDMHKRCIELLRLIDKKERHKFIQYFTEGYMPDDTLISNLVILILTVARGSAMASQQFGIKTSPEGGIASRIVISCEDVMHEYLAKNGDRACKEVKAFCKNKDLGEQHGLQVQGNREFAYWTSLEEVVDPALMAALQTGVGFKY